MRIAVLALALNLSKKSHRILKYRVNKRFLFQIRTRSNNVGNYIVSSYKSPRQIEKETNIHFEEVARDELKISISLSSTNKQTFMR